MKMLRRTYEKSYKVSKIWKTTLYNEHTVTDREYFSYNEQLLLVAVH